MSKLLLKKEGSLKFSYPVSVKYLEMKSDEPPNLYFSDRKQFFSSDKYGLFIQAATFFFNRVRFQHIIEKLNVLNVSLLYSFNKFGRNEPVMTLLNMYAMLMLSLHWWRFNYLSMSNACSNSTWTCPTYVLHRFRNFLSIQRTCIYSTLAELKKKCTFCIYRPYLNMSHTFLFYCNSRYLDRKMLHRK